MSAIKSMQDLLENLRSTSSNNEKIKYLESVKTLPENEQDFIKNILLFTYSPQENFFIKPIKDFEQQSVTELQNYDVLDALNLFKTSLRGNKARDFYIDFKNMCQSNNRQFEAELLDLVLNKDLAAGVAVNTINKVFNKMIPKQPYMRCSLVKEITNPAEWFDGTEIYSQEKMDGMFVNINIDSNGKVEFISRAGSVFPETQAIQELGKTMTQFLPNYQYHGELLVLDKETKEFLPREIGNGILNAVAKNSKNGKKFNHDEHELCIVLWDMIPAELLNNDAKSLPYSERFNQLQNIIQQSNSNNIRMVETNIYDNLDDAQLDFKEKLINGKEGVCWKLATMEWQNTTSRKIIKLKNTFEVDLKIIGFIDGKGKNEQYFGSIRTQSEDGKLIVDVSGFSDEMRKEIAENKDDYIGKIMSVKAANITQTNDTTYSLFLPRFAEFRQDKHEADDFNRIQQQYDESLNQYNPVQELRKKLQEKQKKLNKKANKP